MPAPETMRVGIDRPGTRRPGRRGHSASTRANTFAGDDAADRRPTCASHSMVRIEPIDATTDAVRGVVDHGHGRRHGGGQRLGSLGGVGDRRRRRGDRRGRPSASSVASGFEDLLMSAP
ncbi:MAG: hypothetical protein R2710_16170 [Acidimicrobiales bacterium]